MTIQLGISPCPNDTFIFDALIHKKIDTQGIDFQVFLEDVETLNQWALLQKLDATKLSFPAYFSTIDFYDLLCCGGALGQGVGPILISKTHFTSAKEIENKTIAIPGVLSTAHLLLKYAYPNAQNTKPVLFSKIESAVLNNEVDMGVIIHENRFTYQKKGLYKIIDLGQFWEERKNLPIPLGGIVIKTELGNNLKSTLENLIQRSLSFALENYPGLPAFVTANAFEMDESIMRKHIELYVNQYSMRLDGEGYAAIEALNHEFQGLMSCNTPIR